MNIFKILVLVLGLALVAFTVKIALSGTLGADDPQQQSAPKRQLDSVRQRAQEISGQEQRHVDEAADPAAPER